MKYIRNKTIEYIRNLQNNKMSKELIWNLQIWPYQHVYNAYKKLSTKNWPSEILFVGNINKFMKTSI